MKLTYQPAQSEDTAALFQFNKDLIDEYEDVKAIAYDKVLIWAKNKISTNLPAYRCIFRDGVKVGYVCFHPHEDMMEIDDLYILQPYRHSGIGTQVITDCLNSCQSPVMLYVFNKNEPALRLYRQMGFKTAEKVGSTRQIMRYDC